MQVDRSVLNGTILVSMSGNQWGLGISVGGKGERRSENNAYVWGMSCCCKYIDFLFH